MIYKGNLDFYTTFYNIYSKDSVTFWWESNAVCLSVTSSRLNCWTDLFEIWYDPKKDIDFLKFV